MSLVTEVARESKIPVYGSSATMVDSGASASIAISDKGIGAESADMAVEILEGKSDRRCSFNRSACFRYSYQ